MPMNITLLIILTLNLSRDIIKRFVGTLNHKIMYHNGSRMRTHTNDDKLITLMMINMSHLYTVQYCLYTRP